MNKRRFKLGIIFRIGGRVPAKETAPVANEEGK